MEGRMSEEDMQSLLESVVQQGMHIPQVNGPELPLAGGGGTSTAFSARYHQWGQDHSPGWSSTRSTFGQSFDSVARMILQAARKNVTVVEDSAKDSAERVADKDWNTLFRW